MHDLDDAEEKLSEVGIGAALAIGTLAAAMAVAFRVGVGPRLSGEQAIFSYPAIIIVTLLTGRRAGFITAAICFLLLWYLVVPYKQSLVVESPKDGTALAVYAFVAGAFILYVGRLRIVFYRYRRLAFLLERRVEALTAQRARMWEHVPDWSIIASNLGTIEAANPSFARLCGSSSNALEGANLKDLFAAEDWNRFIAARDQLIEGVTAVRFPARVVSGSDVVNASWSMARDGTMLYLVGRD